MRLSLQIGRSTSRVKQPVQQVGQQHKVGDRLAIGGGYPGSEAPFRSINDKKHGFLQLEGPHFGGLDLV